VAAIPPGARIVAVDGGLDVARAAGLRPDRLIGDLDSISTDGLAWAEANVDVERHPTAKDATDTELALRAAATSSSRITLVGGGDRLDHTLAALGALAAPALAGVERLDGWWDGQHFEVLHGPAERALVVVAGSTVSLIALGGPCTGVRVAGTRWVLDGVDLVPTVGLGVSNEAAAPPVVVAVESGVLAVFDEPTGRRPPDATPRSKEMTT
jgi:thiamine pyrophosphokinase